MTEPVKSVALFYRDGSSDKEYHASIEPQGGGYVVNFAYGRRGSTLTNGTKTQSPVPLAQAEKIYDKLVAEKTGKGYVADGSATPFSGTETAGRVTGLVPMLLNAIDEKQVERYIEDPEWMMQEKLDGKRIMARVAGGVVTASNRKGLSVGVPREIEDELKKLGDIVVDGELIGSKYVMFDVLEADGQDKRGDTAWQRFMFLVDALADIGLTSLKHIETVRSALSPADKRKLYADMQHKEGVVVKHVDGKYVAGRPNSGGNQLKCKFWSSATCRVGAVNAKRSFVAQVQGPNGLVNVGNVTVPANKEVPTVGEFVEVKYLYWYPGGSLYQPQYLGARDDKDVADDISTLKPKSDDTDEENEPAFVPVIEPEFMD
jgi:bifunctional non-homologous end joining protein LigD